MKSILANEYTGARLGPQVRGLVKRTGFLVHVSLLFLVPNPYSRVLSKGHCSPISSQTGSPGLSIPIFYTAPVSERFRDSPKDEVIMGPGLRQQIAVSFLAPRYHLRNTVLHTLSHVLCCTEGPIPDD